MTLKRQARTPRHCPHCGATTAGCASLQLLGGRTCCDPCPGTHDDTDPTPSGAAA